jgi:hypothetical protein
MFSAASRIRSRVEEVGSSLIGFDGFDGFDGWLVG